jgi:hypothetical protein
VGFSRTIETARLETLVEPDHTLSLIAASPDLQRRVCSYARSCGLSHLKFLGSGSWSTVFESDEGRILRITPNPRPRPRHPAILQAYSECVITGGTIRVKLEILPRLRTDNVTREDCTLIVNALVSSGFFITDIFRRNTGRLPDGTPLLIDPDDEYPPIVIGTLGPALNIFKTNGGGWKQHEAFPGLRRGRSPE